MSSPTSQTFGRYLLVELLAQGGMGHVYRALLRSESGFEKPVALKRVLKQLCQDPDFVMRFADEARIASTLTHSNIVQVFDFGEVDGEYFLAMELVDGPDLGTLIAASNAQQKELTIPAILFITAGICRGLGAAHDRRVNQRHAPVIHRDISPPNVLLTRDGEIKVTDFGIAKAADKALRTRTGLVMGKCRYMAPEQAMGQPVSPATDIFSVGCVLYEMLHGQTLFEGPTPDAIIQAVIASSPLPDRPFREMPNSLWSIVKKALARDPGQRFSNGTEMAREVERLLHTIAPGFARDDIASILAALLDERASTEHNRTPAIPLDQQPTAPKTDMKAASTPTEAERIAHTHTFPGKGLTEGVAVPTKRPQRVSGRENQHPASQTTLGMGHEDTPVPTPGVRPAMEETGAASTAHAPGAILEQPSPQRSDSLPRPLLARRRGWLLPLAALVGGVASGFIIPDARPRAVARDWTPGQPSQIGSHQLILASPTATGTKTKPSLCVQLRVIPKIETRALGGRFLLVQGSSTARPPTFYTETKDGGTQLCFAASANGGPFQLIYTAGNDTDTFAFTLRLRRTP